MGRKRKNSLEGIGGIFSLLRPLFTIFILSAFVLGLSFGVKALLVTDSQELLTMLNPLLARLNIDQERVGEVAGDFVSRLAQTGVEDTNNAAVPTSQDNMDSKEDTVSDIQPVTALPEISDEELQLQMALLADSHSNYANLTKAFEMAKSKGIKDVLFLGDLTELGILDDLQNAKKTMDASGLTYNALPGDHDLWKSVGPENFIDVFGKNYFAVNINGIRFIGMDNSANYTLISEERMNWFKIQLTEADFVILSQPLYHPKSLILMGYVNGAENPEIRAQAEEILEMIRKSNVKAVIAADQHLSSENVDPVRQDLHHVVIGALTEERNMQTPRFGIMRISKNGSYQIRDVLLE